MAKAFHRLDHLICQVPDIESAFRLFTEDLGFPVAWPIGRFWPQGRTAGIALGGANLELLQEDETPTRQAYIRVLAFEPTAEILPILRSERIGYKVFRKKESNPELLALRNLPTDQGEQELCTNTLPDEAKLEFRMFACDYAPIPKSQLSPSAFQVQNVLQEVVLGHSNPDRLESQLKRLGIESGVKLSVVKHPTKEVVALRMRSPVGPHAGFPARFRFE